MKFTKLYVEKWLGQKASPAANEALLESLRNGKLREVYWTGHATKRAQEMVNAGFRFEDIRNALANPSSAYMSPTYRQPCVKYGEVSVALLADRFGRAIVVTVLPANRRAWDKFHAAGDHDGRERKDNPFEYRGTDNDDTTGKCISCLTDVTGVAEATARVTKKGTMCGHCYNRDHLPGWSRTIHQRNRPGRGY